MQAPGCRVVNPLDTVPRVRDRSQGYRHSGVEKKPMGTSFPDTPRQVLGGALLLWLSARGQGPSLYRTYNTVNRWHNIRVYREKLRDNASRAV